VIVLHVVKEVLNVREISECRAGFTIFAPMSSKEQKFTSSRVRTSYASVVVSMTLVLFVLGVLGILVFSAKDLSRTVRENFTFTLVLEEDIPEAELRTMLKSQQLAPYAKQATLVTKEEAAEVLKADLGEDFVAFLGYNPLSNTIDVNLTAEFVAARNLDALREELIAADYITEVLYDRDLVALVNDNIEKILAGAAAVLLLVALALINSSIRLTIYSKRFLLKTMQLVGATSGFIRRPYLINSLGLGVLSAALSSGILYGALYGFAQYFPAFDTLFTEETFLKVVGVLLFMGLIVPGVSTAVAIRRYLKLRTNELYY
jgi:cell division transport system permease protein